MIIAVFSNALNVSQLLKVYSYYFIDKEVSTFALKEKNETKPNQRSKKLSATY